MSLDSERKIMLHPDALAEVARLRHENDLKQAEANRLYQQLKANQPGLFQRFSTLLKSIGQRVEAQVPSPPAQHAIRSISDQFKQVR
jgi:hypothetical protein